MIHYLGVVFFHVFVRHVATLITGCTKQYCLEAHIAIIMSMSVCFLVFLSFCSFIPTVFEVLFLAALMLSMHTDACKMVLSRYLTLLPIPFMYAAAYSNALPITFIESVMGSITAYFFLFIFEYVYFLITKKSGLGNGDKELLAFIGSGIGFGWWYALLIGSWVGLLVACAYGMYTKTLSRLLRIPFGTFLTFGAIAYFFYMHMIKM